MCNPVLPKGCSKAYEQAGVKLVYEIQTTYPSKPSIAIPGGFALVYRRRAQLRKRLVYSV
jgi:hypothetical protein